MMGASSRSRSLSYCIGVGISNSSTECTESEEHRKYTSPEMNLHRVTTEYTITARCCHIPRAGQRSTMSYFDAGTDDALGGASMRATTVSVMLFASLSLSQTVP